MKTKSSIGKLRLQLKEIQFVRSTGRTRWLAEFKRVRSLRAIESFWGAWGIPSALHYWGVI